MEEFVPSGIEPEDVSYIRKQKKVPTIVEHNYLATAELPKELEVTISGKLYEVDIAQRLEIKLQSIGDTAVPTKLNHYRRR